MRHPFLTEEHEAFRQTIRTFVQREVEPHIESWEREKTFPRELYKKAAEVGLLGVDFPEAYGGMEVDPFFGIVAAQEMARSGSGGLCAGLMSHAIGAPPIAALGSEAIKQEALTQILAGEKISALAVTEPGGGSDVANLATTARREGDHYVINGSKTFITSGMRADWITTAVRTGDAGLGGISLLLIPGDSPGLERTPLEKMGWWCSDTATLYFEDCKVPARYLLGAENAGFMGIMQNFNRERTFIATLAIAFARVCYEEALGWARERKTFGKPLVRHQVVRHKLVDMLTEIEAAEANLMLLAWQISQGAWPVAEVSMLKNFSTAMLERVAGEAVQLLGGMGYIRGTKSERIFRETKVLSIGGGASEIMKELAARQLGMLADL